LTFPMSDRLRQVWLYFFCFYSECKF
jgi:hypothetical protein